ncbi:fasciclin domain-containing protein [Methanoculleus sp. FWC-SCC1]|uniref:Fasciclin domain-containing protein n=1 Tax=Methanoculleus frigidifontis TaxID=2584085 RepID=A0ABT8M7F5_9EURY|nr:fasciclin domain-containing protein [Methanoculleus sp. FWC-SCC1]MDN7023856.1 fasciclin domain-containing protein [Methanoculleus sp. FWC-SCC1]
MKYSMVVLVALIVGLLVLCCGCTTEQPANETGNETTGQTIVEIAAADPQFSTLVAAVQAANLTDALSQEGPYTVFAPTDAAFEALPAGTLDQLMQDPEGDLQQILLYHVVPGRYMASDLAQLNSLETLEGSTLSVNATDGAVTIDDAIVIQSDIEASNGVIHVIDAVMVPPTVDLGAGNMTANETMGAANTS